jgi:hypothetical protein
LRDLSIRVEQNKARAAELRDTYDRMGEILVRSEGRRPA